MPRVIGRAEQLRRAFALPVCAGRPGGVRCAGVGLRDVGHLRRLRAVHGAGAHKEEPPCAGGEGEVQHRPRAGDDGIECGDRIILAHGIHGCVQDKGKPSAVAGRELREDAGGIQLPDVPTHKVDAGTGGEGGGPGGDCRRVAGEHRHVRSQRQPLGCMGKRLQ